MLNRRCKSVIAVSHNQVKNYLQSPPLGFYFRSILLLNVCLFFHFHPQAQSSRDFIVLHSGDTLYGQVQYDKNEVDISTGVFFNSIVSFKTLNGSEFENVTNYKLCFQSDNRIYQRVHYVPGVDINGMGINPFEKPRYTFLHCLLIGNKYYFLMLVNRNGGHFFIGNQQRTITYLDAGYVSPSVTSRPGMTELDITRIGLDFTRTDITIHESYKDTLRQICKRENKGPEVIKFINRATYCYDDLLAIVTKLNDSIFYQYDPPKSPPLSFYVGISGGTMWLKNTLSSSGYAWGLFVLHDIPLLRFKNGSSILLRPSISLSKSYHNGYFVVSDHRHFYLRDQLSMDGSVSLFLPVTKLFNSVRLSVGYRATIFSIDPHKREQVAYDGNLNNSVDLGMQSNWQNAYCLNFDFNKKWQVSLSYHSWSKVEVKDLHTSIRPKGLSISFAHKFNY